MSLAEFVKPKCPVCILPQELKIEMEQGHKDGIGYSAMVEWLKEEHEITMPYAKIKNHFGNAHDAR